MPSSGLTLIFGAVVKEPSFVGLGQFGSGLMGSAAKLASPLWARVW